MGRVLSRGCLLLKARPFIGKEDTKLSVRVIDYGYAQTSMVTFTVYMELELMLAFIYC